EPGASEVFVQLGGRMPKPRALRASSPAATSRRGSDVLVQLVIAAMATAPWPGPSPATGEPFSIGASAVRVALAEIRSCGRRGPDTLVSTAERSISRTCV